MNSTDLGATVLGATDLKGLDHYSTFAKEGGRVGSGALGSGQGGVARCVR